MRRYSILTAVGLAMALAVGAPARGQSHSKEIMGLDPARLVEILRKPDATAFDKAKACQRLAVVGTPDAIPALVALLPDEKLNLYARFGLEGIPGPAVDEALRGAASRLQGRPLVGVIDSIGQRKDPKAVDLLKGFLTHAEVPVASAAAGALGRIGTPEAAAVLAEALGKDSPVKPCIGDACLACAEGLAGAGKRAEAVALYEAATKADLPMHQKTGALDGLFRLRQAEAKPMLLQLLGSDDKALFQLALGVAREMPGADVTAAIAEWMPKLPAERQALVLRAMGDRKEPAPLAAVLAATKSASPAVRQAAIYVLARRGDASAVGALLDAALAEGEVSQVAQEGLKTLESPEVDKAVVSKLASADAKAKAVLFDLIGARRIAAAHAAVREALDDADEGVRLGAMAALAQLIDLKDLDLLAVPAMKDPSAKETAAARDALKTAALRMADREAAAAKLAGYLKDASAENQSFLLELLGRVSGKKALEVVVAGAKSHDAALKDAATRVLGEWVNADAAPALLDIAKNDPDGKYQVRALRGYIRIARQLQLPNDERLAMFHTAMEAASRAEEKQIALDILSRIPSPRTLKLAVSYLDQPELKNAAADAAVKIAAKVVTRQPKPVAEAMQKVVAAGVGGDPGNRARQLLQQAKAGAK